jgi:MtN3 and saliva related transmembrane protein
MEELGLLAALLTSISQLPQVIKTLKTKDTHSISLWTYLMLWVGIMLWLIYGILKEDTPLILANIISVILTGIIIILKIKYK